MKILFAIDTLGKGGAERVISNLANYFTNENNVLIMTLRQVPTAYELDSRINIINVEKQNKNKIAREIENIRNIEKIVNEYSPDIIVTFLPAMTYRLMLANRKCKKKVIISVRNNPKVEYSNILKRILMKILYSKADGFVFQTEEAKSFFSKKIQNKSVIIPNPINEKFIIEPFKGERKKEIVSVGRLEEQKNQQLLIRAFSKLSKEYNDYKLVIYGEGSERENLENLVKDLNIENNVELPGETDDIKNKIYDASLFVLSSNYEGMPNALMEAMALGIPVIATDCPCGGPRFLISNNQNGILVPIDDEDKMKEAIEKLLDNKELANTLSLNANKISVKLHPQKILEAWEKYIKEIERKIMIHKLLNYLKHPQYFLLWLDKKRIITLNDKLYLKILYKKEIGKKLNLDNPQTFNEKLQWLKLNDRKDIYTTMVDKYEVKKYVSNIIGDEYIIPTIGVYDKFEDIDFDSLPNQFVMKCTHDSGSTIVCKDKGKFNKEEAKAKLEKALKHNYFYDSREWPYKNVKPRIIIEKYMVDESGIELKDYKIFNFDGKSKIIQVDYDRFETHKRNLYTTDWEYIDLQIKFPKDPNHIIARPKKLELMIQLAEKLSQKISHVRTDFYVIGDKIYFGELTFYHGGGYEKFTPEEWNRKLGDMIKLNNY